MKAKPLLAFYADSHVGSNTALAPKSFKNDDKQVILASPIQKWLLANWNTAWKEVWERGKGRYVIVVFDGDAIDGNHHGTTQIMPNVTDQIAACVELFEPVVHKANEFWMVRGTAAHTGESGSDEKNVAHDLGVVKNYTWELLAEWENKLFNIAHHVGGRIDNVVAKCREDAQDLGEPIPHYVVRAHRHIVDDTGFKFPNTRGFVLPAWQLRTGYGYQVAPNRVASIGMTLVDFALDGDPIICRRFYAKRNIIRRRNLG